MEKYKFKGLAYHRGKPDFSEIASYTIQIYNFSDYISPTRDSDRERLQNKAFEILAKKLDYDINVVVDMKEKNRLVWHEDTDCKTLYLVPQEIHNNLHHFGGIGMLRILRNCGLV